MLLRFLKINDSRSWIYLFVFSLALGIFAVSIGVKHIPVHQNSVLSFFHFEYAGFGAKIAGVFLLICNVLLFDFVATSQELTDKSNHVPAYLLGLYLIFSLAEDPLHPQLMAQLFFTYSFYRYISTYRVEKAAANVFDGAFCLSLAVMLYPPYWVFFATGFVCLGVLCAFHLREYSLVIMGLLLPYVFYYTILFVADLPLGKPLADIRNSFHAPAMPQYYQGSFLINFVSILVILFTIIFFIKKGVLSGRIKTQKVLTVFLWLFIPCAAAIFISQDHYVVTALMAVMPLSLFCGIYFGTAKRRTLAEILLLLLTATVIVSLMQHAGYMQVT
jgi:hypothetical protein